MAKLKTKPLPASQKDEAQKMDELGYFYFDWDPTKQPFTNRKAAVDCHQYSRGCPPNWVWDSRIGGNVPPPYLDMELGKGKMPKGYNDDPFVSD